MLKLGQEVFQGDLRSFRNVSALPRSHGVLWSVGVGGHLRDREGTRSTAVSKDTNRAVRELKSNLPAARHREIGTSKKITWRFLLHHLTWRFSLCQSSSPGTSRTLVGSGCAISVHGNEAELEESKHDHAACQ